MLGAAWHLPLSKAAPSYCAAECSACQQHRLKQSPWMVPALKESSQPLTASWLHGTPTLKEAVICSYWNRYLIWIFICLPCPQCVYQDHHQRDNRMFGLPNEIPCNTVSNQRAPSMEEEIQLLLLNIAVPRRSHLNITMEQPVISSAEVSAQRQLHKLRCYHPGCHSCTESMPGIAKLCGSRN